MKESKEETKCNIFLESGSVLLQIVAHRLSCIVFSGRIFERQFLNNSNDGFLEQLVPQSRGKNREMSRLFLIKPKKNSYLV